MADRVYLLVGTHKGGFILEGNPERNDWKIAGTCFEGTDIQHLTIDTREGRNRLYAAVNSPWWGPGVRMSDDLGQTWSEPSAPPKFEESLGLNLERVWQITPSRDHSPGTVFVGVDPAALFRSDDHGDTWTDVRGLTTHPTRGQWAPGAGGMMVHGILVHPYDPRRMQVAISAAGCFETIDGGENWMPRNKGVLADFLPEPYPEVGQCVHHLQNHPTRPDLLYQSNHCGVYRSNMGGEQWTDLSEGLPSRFGFACVVHPLEDDTVYVVPMVGPELRAPVDAQLAVYRNREREGWERLTAGLPQDHAYPTVYRQAMVADQLDPAGLYLGTSNGQIFSSLDAGDSWQSVMTDLPSVYSIEAVAL